MQLLGQLHVLDYNTAAPDNADSDGLRHLLSPVVRFGVTRPGQQVLHASLALDCTPPLPLREFKRPHHRSAGLPRRHYPQPRPTARGICLAYGTFVRGVATDKHHASAGNETGHMGLGVDGHHGTDGPPESSLAS